MAHLLANDVWVSPTHSLNSSVFLYVSQVSFPILEYVCPVRDPQGNGTDYLNLRSDGDLKKGDPSVLNHQYIICENALFTLNSQTYVIGVSS